MKKNSWQKTPKTKHICDHPDCHESGDCRAPKDRALNSYHWFCQKHAAEYNKKWDFYLGLSTDEIEQHLRNDTTWQRPTWRLGQNATPTANRIQDGFDIFEEVSLGMNGKYTPPQTQHAYEKRFVKAAEFMQLTIPFTKNDLKKQYKKLAKQYHPDTSKTNHKEATKLFQKLTDSYQYLLERSS